MWHYQVNDKQYGPVDFKQFAELIENGVITKDTPVLTEIMSDWRKAGDIPALKKRYFSSKRVSSEEQEVYEKKVGYIAMGVIGFVILLIILIASSGG